MEYILKVLYYFLYKVNYSKNFIFYREWLKTLRILVKLRSALFLKPQNSLDIERGGCGFREHCSLNTIMRFIVGQARRSGLERIAWKQCITYAELPTEILDWLAIFRN